MDAFGFFGYGMTTLVLFAFMFAIIGYAGVLLYFFSKAFNTEDSIIIDTKQEALDRKL